MSQKLKDLLAEDARRRSEDVGAVGGQRRSFGDLRGPRQKRDRESETLKNALHSSNPNIRASFDVLQSDGIFPNHSHRSVRSHWSGIHWLGGHSFCQPHLRQCFFAGQESEEHTKWTKIWNENPVLENIYLNRREVTLAMQRIAAAPTPGEDCAEECRASLDSAYLADMSQDLLKLANRPTFEVSLVSKPDNLDCYIRPGHCICCPMKEGTAITVMTPWCVSPACASANSYGTCTAISLVFNSEGSFRLLLLCHLEMYNLPTGHMLWYSNDTLGRNRDKDIEKCDGALQVKATLKYGDLMGEGDMVCSAAFDRDDEFFATAGVSKRIKVLTAKLLFIHTSTLSAVTESAQRSDLCCIDHT